VINVQIYNQIHPFLFGKSCAGWSNQANAIVNGLCLGMRID